MPRRSYTARQGDTLESVAAAFGTTAAQLALFNPWLGASLTTGDVLVIPSGNDDVPPNVESILGVKLPSGPPPSSITAKVTTPEPPKEGGPSLGTTFAESLGFPGALAEFTTGIPTGQATNILRLSEELYSRYLGAAIKAMKEGGIGAVPTAIDFLRTIGPTAIEETASPRITGRTPFTQTIRKLRV